MIFLNHEMRQIDKSNHVLFPLFQKEACGGALVHQQQYALTEIELEEKVEIIMLQFYRGLELLY